MTDSGRFRFGQRPRTPVPPPSPTTSSSHDAEEQSRRSAVPRIPSRLSLHSRPSPTELLTPTNTDLLVREQDKIWHNPSVDQMIETLQVSIMTRGAMEPIPVAHNTYVLRLIESLCDHQERLAAADAACEEIKKARSQTLEDINTVTEEWSKREDEYKQEIKRLEVLLCSTQQGMESVTLARANSIVERQQPNAKKFVTRLQELRDEAAAREAAAAPRISELETSVFLGQSIVTDAQIMRVMDQSQPIQERGVISHEPRRQPPLPNILNTGMDFEQSQRIRRADAAAAADASSRPGRQHNRTRAFSWAGHALRSPVPNSSGSETGSSGATVTEPWTGVTGVADTAGTTDVAGTAAAPGQPRLGGREAGARSDGHDGDEAEPRPRVTGGADMSRVAARPSPNKAPEGHFSFLPGDDMLVAAGCQTDGQPARRAYEQARRHVHAEDESATPRPRRLPDESSAPRTQGPRTAATGTPARGVEGSSHAGHGPTGGTTPDLGHGSVSGGAGHGQGPWEQTGGGQQTQGPTSAQIAARRAVARMRERDEHKNTS